MIQFFLQSKLILLCLLSLAYSSELDVTKSDGCPRTNVYAQYDSLRNLILESEYMMGASSKLELSDEEVVLNAVFKVDKYNEIYRGLQNYSLHPSAMHFFEAKPLIEQSKVFEFIKKMPKGAVLHLHASAAVSSKWVMENISYTPGLLKCINRNGVTILTFRQEPKKHGCQSEYVRIEDERANATSVAEYDKYFESLINLYTPKPKLDHPDINFVWTKFNNMFTTVEDMLSYIDVFRAYYRQMLVEMYEDKIMYGEIRLRFKELYGINGEIYPERQNIEELLDIVKKFKAEHEDFLGIKIIYAIDRNLPRYKILKHIQNFQVYGEQYPNVVIGIDMDGQEDLGRPIYSLVDMLINLPKGTKFLFHAGESKLFGSSSDINLLDAILLNATRIGHGYALSKHPLLWKLVKNHDIAIEISPISNQVLQLVWDLRNHPASAYLSQNIPVVICNDHPGFWNSKALSYDYYYTIMSVAPANAGIRMLKYLVSNSINYAILTESEREQAFNLLAKQWQQFIHEQISLI